jgi:hypothetical protein
MWAVNLKTFPGFHVPPHLPSEFPSTAKFLKKSKERHPTWVALNSILANEVEHPLRERMVGEVGL